MPKSELFAHLNFRKSDMSFMNKIQENLLEQFRSDESYEFIRNHPEWLILGRSGIHKKIGSGDKSAY